MKKILLLITILNFILDTNGQNVGIGTPTPNATAKLEVSSTTSGFLPPRMTYVQRLGILNPAQGLIIYCTDCGTNGQLQNFDGVNWLSMVSGIGSIGPNFSTIITTTITSITASTANSGGNITSDGGATITRRGLIYSINAIADTTSIVGGGKIINASGGTGTYASFLTSLSANTTYHVRAFAVNSVGVSFGADLSFTTLITLPNVTTTTASNITANAASSGGNVTADGGATITRRGLIYSTNSIVDTTSIVGGGKIIDAATGTGNYSSLLNSLAGNTIYHIRAFAVNAAGVSFGADLTFATLIPITLPIVATTASSSITTNSASSGGNVIDDGGATVTRRGLIYSTNAIVDTTSIIGGGKIINASGGTGSFISLLTALVSSTTYHFRSFAVNTAGVSYGADLSFTTSTPITLPNVTTTTATSITAISASSGGNVTTDGGATVIRRGLIYSTNSIIDSTSTIGGGKMIDASTGIGTYSNFLTGLASSTTYHVRAFAVNSVGVSYGADLTFTTLSNAANLPSITICSQIWTDKNLDVTTYRDGSIIPQVTDDVAWGNLTTGAWCYFSNNNGFNATYGKLYNWYAVNDPRGLAPTGWHIATDAEWTKLVDTCLGGSNVAGDKMKEIGTTHWTSNSPGVTNSSGFTGLPGGFRTASGFFNIQYTGYWWGSTVVNTSSAIGYTMFSSFSTVISNPESKVNGFSVRCVKN